jgi:1,4-alpha-glucan branching enzyme
VSATSRAPHADGTSAPIGTFCLVLHSHLPWLAGHGTWPVGEEWLHQAWAQSYGPVLDVLIGLAAEGRQQVLTLGLTPVLAAQLDDPYCLAEHHTWLVNWQQRAAALLDQRDPALKRLGRHEHRTATHAMRRMEQTWRHGASGVVRDLADAGTIEVLGGPAAHPFQPLLPERVAAFSLSTGLTDHAIRLGSPSRGIWAPECAYRPGLEDLYADHGVTHFMVDGPTLQHVGATTSRGHRVGASDVVAFGRDLDVSYRVWSPRRGYPGGRWYRDFHTYHHGSGFKHARVTSRSTAPADKAPYDPGRATAAVHADVDDFVEVVRRRLHAIAERDGSPGLVVAAYDTELFGHWWYEGPQWLGQVLRALPAAGIRLSTLAGALSDDLVAGSVSPHEGTWGLGKDFHVWDSPETADIVGLNRAVCDELLTAADLAPRPDIPDRRLDEAAREALLALQSDWAFMVSHRSAVDYARSRAHGHAERMRTLLAGEGTPARPDRRRPTDAPGSPFGVLDARFL